MKKILILGSAGMAGHMITRYLLSLKKYNLYTLARNDKYVYANYYIDIQKELDMLKPVIDTIKYDIIINCIGLLVSQAKENLKKALYINYVFPHWLENRTKNMNTKIIHLSTDCVFLGTKGNYTETDKPDEISNYGMSKILGEIKNEKDLTLRLSIIGSELKKDGSGLFEWFMKQKGDIGMGF